MIWPLWNGAFVISIFKEMKRYVSINDVLLTTLTNVSGLICFAVIKHQLPNAETVIMIVRDCTVDIAD